MLRINQAQREYYEHAVGATESELNGVATNLSLRVSFLLQKKEPAALLARTS
jgi:hypothetical protein